MHKCLHCGRELMVDEFFGTVNAVEFDFNTIMGICGLGEYGSIHDNDLITIIDTELNEKVYEELITVEDISTRKTHKRVHICDDCISNCTDKFEIHKDSYGPTWRNAINDNRYNLMSLAGYNNIVTPICKECLSFTYDQIKSAYAFLEQHVEINKYWDIQKTKDVIKFRIRHNNSDNFQYFCEGKILIIPADIRDIHLVTEDEFKRRYKLKY